MLTLFAGRDRAGRAVHRARHRALRRSSSAACSSAAIYVAPSQYECLFPSLAHGDEEIDETIEAVAASEAGTASGLVRRRSSRRACGEPRLGGVRCCRATSASSSPVFSPLAPRALALGLETVYEAYLVHYGRPRLFDAPDADEAVLLGDYLYAHGLVRDRRGRRRAGRRGARRADRALRRPARRRRRTATATPGSRRRARSAARRRTTRSRARSRCTSLESPHDFRRRERGHPRHPRDAGRRPHLPRRDRPRRARRTGPATAGPSAARSPHAS